VTIFQNAFWATSVFYGLHQKSGIKIGDRLLERKLSLFTVKSAKLSFLLAERNQQMNQGEHMSEKQ
jgi:hypothetical protein